MEATEGLRLKAEASRPAVGVGEQQPGGSCGEPIGAARMGGVRQQEHMWTQEKLESKEKSSRIWGWSLATTDNYIDDLTVYLTQSNS